MKKIILISLILAIMLVGLFAIKSKNEESINENFKDANLEHILTEATFPDLLDAIAMEEIRVIDTIEITNTHGLVFTGYNQTIGVGFYLYDDNKYHWLGRLKLANFDNKDLPKIAWFTCKSPTSKEIKVTIGICDGTTDEDKYKCKDGFIYGIEVLD